MNILKATERYEAWLRGHISLIDPDLASKHEQMRQSVFLFLRGTYYRWAQVFPSTCQGAADVPRVLAVGDLHVENFGTWRDREGRLVWGINDFDEAYPLPYTNDLVRLAVSAKFAIDESRLKLGFDEACHAVQSGYAEGLEAGGRPYILAEDHQWLQAIAVNELRDPEHFWGKLESLAAPAQEPTGSAVKALRRLLPDSELDCRVVHRMAGLGSLGRERWVAIAEWQGGKLAREVKALAPSACVWAAGSHDDKIRYEKIMSRAVRAPDPYIELYKGWVVRRLSPDCSRIELGDLPHERDEARLLHAMGFETANVHLGSRSAREQVLLDLGKRSPDWLHEAARAMVRATEADWEEWKQDSPISRGA